MADASLTVRMALERLALKQGLDGANADVDGFKKKFETSLRDTRGAVKDVAGSIDGIGRALDGSIQGAVAGFKDFTQLLSTSPWAAWSAVGVAAITGVVKAVENMYTKLDEAGGRAGKERAKSRKDVIAALGFQSPDELSGKSYGELREGAKAAKAETEKLTEQITALNKQITGLEQNVSFYDALSLTGEDTASQVIGLKNQLAELEKQRGESARKANAQQEEADKRELAAAQNRTKRGNDALRAEGEAAKERERERERDLKAYDKYVKAFNEREQSLSELDADRKEKEKDIFGKSRSSIFDRGDIYQRMGGQVGANLSPALREADLKSQREKEMVELMRRSTEASVKIEQAFYDALNKLED